MSQQIRGIRLATHAAGIKKPGRDDLVLIELAPGTCTAAVFTRNAFCAAPVQLAKQHLAQSTPRFLLINSGNANAGTGDKGLQAAIQCCEAIAGVAGCQASEVLPFSTGVIGQPLPVEKITRSISALHQGLQAANWDTAARAIMTTDTRPKLVSRQLEINGERVTLIGIAKGAGMIHPNMATMLAYVATDASLSDTQLQASLHEAVGLSFNRISIDGDTSTNDALVLMATGQTSLLQDDDLVLFQRALNELCINLAKAIVRDGEGATKLITIEIEGAGTVKEAEQVAFAIAHSPLVKTAFFASDPNWGRILAAVGYAGLDQLNVNKVDIYLDDVCIVSRGGVAESYTEQQGQQVMAKPEITVRVSLNRGEYQVRVWTCDFSYDYVRINAEYRT